MDKSFHVGKIDISSAVKSTAPPTWNEVKALYDANPPTGGVNVVEDSKCQHVYYCVKCMEINLVKGRGKQYAKCLRQTKTGKCKRCGVDIRVTPFLSG